MKSSGVFPCLMLGLPGTGKTTFLAALWHAVEAGDVPNAIKVSKLEGDRTYLNSIRDKWLKCEILERTPMGSSEFISMSLVDDLNVPIGEFQVPDLSGELFNVIWRDRGWSPAIDNLARSCRGLLLFLNPLTLKEPAFISSAQAAVAELETHAERGQSDPSETATEWNTDLACDQVKLVETLQFIFERHDIKAIKLKAAAVISAWDTVKDKNPDKNPTEWLRERVPLLDQFLEANRERLSTEVWGVSAQGGTLEERTHLLALKPSERPIVQSGTSINHDITLPLRKILGEADG
jgi:hypothetical protein